MVPEVTLATMGREQRLKYSPDTVDEAGIVGGVVIGLEDTGMLPVNSIWVILRKEIRGDGMLLNWKPRLIYPVCGSIFLVRGFLGEIDTKKQVQPLCEATTGPPCYKLQGLPPHLCNQLPFPGRSTPSWKKIVALRFLICRCPRDVTGATG